MTDVSRGAFSSKIPGVATTPDLLVVAPQSIPDGEDKKHNFILSDADVSELIRLGPFVVCGSTEK